MIRFYFFVLLIALGLPATAQRICGTVEHQHSLEMADPGVALNRQLIEQHTQQFQDGPGQKVRTVITIPVVVHVVYNLASQNISDAQIQSQIDVLNQDFRKLNPDFVNTPGVFQSAGADCEIHFVLARRTPNGDSTTGITRTATAVSSFTYNDNVKYTALGGRDAWPATDYLNIWVCKLSNGLLGYAQFPGGPAATDGVVVSFRAFGTNGAVLAPFNKGRTATHEVGHWLNLYHIWGDDGGSCAGSDLVNDTPNQASENYGCPTYPKLSCNNGPGGEMFMNFMDYTDDACMSLFTHGQKSRMDALFAPGGARVSLLNSLGGQYPTQVVNCGVPVNPAAGNMTAYTASLSWNTVPNAVSYTLQVRIAGSANWTNYTPSINSFPLSGLLPSTTYEFQVQATCTSGTGAFSGVQSFSTLPAPVCGTPAGLQTTNLTHQAVTLGWSAVVDASQYSIQYRESGSADWLTLLSNTNSLPLQNLIPLTAYEFQVSATCPYGNSPYAPMASFTTLSSPAPNCSNAFEPNETRLTAAPIQRNTLYAAQIFGGGDIDYYSFTTTASQPKFKVSLTNVPADYDLKIYNANGIQVLSSQNARIQNEVCVSNNTVGAGTYYIRVGGYNGKYDPVNCYRILVETSGNDFKEDEVNIETETAKPSIVFFPNPATDHLNTEYFAEDNREVVLQVYSILGNRVLSQSFTTQFGLNTFELNVSGLPNGVYILESLDRDERHTERFVIQR